ncbi:MAG: hypothetical protein NTZ90_12955 [Proteobacteria bacterium]|nr:hypothetical protein [Pseudomonadota bacterium]
MDFGHSKISTCALILALATLSSCGRWPINSGRGSVQDALPSQDLVPSPAIPPLLTTESKEPLHVASLTVEALADSPVSMVPDLAQNKVLAGMNVSAPQTVAGLGTGTPNFVAPPPTAAPGTPPTPTPTIIPPPDYGIKDYGSLFWVSDGYDVLTGSRRNSCLDQATLVFRKYPINQAYDNMEMVFSKADLARKLSVDVNVEASTVYNGISLAPSIKSNILHETELTSTSVVAVASFLYIKDQVLVYNSIPPLVAERALDLQTDPASFRSQCGDKFTRSIRTGASMILIIRAEQVGQTAHDLTMVQETFKLGFGELLGLSPSVTITPDQKDILSHYRVSTTCYSEGVSAHICADHQLDMSGVNFNDASVVSRIGAAKGTLASEVQSGLPLAAVDEQVEVYPVPPILKSKNPKDVFVDYRPNLDKIQQWIKLEEQVHTICASIPQLEDSCGLAKAVIAEALDICARQSLWPFTECRAPSRHEFPVVLDAVDAGRVTLWEDGRATGRALVLDFSKLFSRDARYQANVVYNLGDDRFDFANVLSSITHTLKNGWELMLFSDADGNGKQWAVQPGMRSYLDMPLGFNDQALSFRLQRVPAAQ